MTNKMMIKIEDERVRALSERDPLLGKLIRVVGDYELGLQTDYYEALLKKIIGQQLSVKAAATIWGRVAELSPIVEPANIQAISDDGLRAVGVSRPKIKYIRDLTEKVVSGELNMTGIDTMQDEEVIRTLTKVKGIGTWSAEMFLIFSLGRENIFSFADVGLRRGIKWLYQVQDEEIESLRVIEKWAPYKTFASLYLWEVVNQNFVYDYPNIEKLIENRII
jgi:DNA-3-methyladenine glycosylase II